jgi:NADPH:quinone reductase-like Zn-dependent oxidoreductase
MAIPVPEGLGLEQAAAVPEAFLTAREALFTLGRSTKDSTVLVHAAAGGIGPAGVQLAKERGARVIATAGSNEKLERVRSFGADVLVNYKTEDFAKRAMEITDGAGVDVVLDFIGASYWQKHSTCLAIGGRCVIIGVLGGATAEVNLAQVLRRRLQILGLVMRSRPTSDKIAITGAFIEQSLPALADGRLRPVVDRVFALENAAAAHAYMETNQNVGKIVLRVRHQ